MIAVNVRIRGIPGYGKAPASCWRERVDNAGASFAWRAPSSSRPFEGARVLTGYCTLVKGFGNSGSEIELKQSMENGETGKEVGEGRWALFRVFMASTKTIAGSSFHRSTASRTCTRWLPATTGGCCPSRGSRSEEHTSELQSQSNLVC